MPSNGNLPNYMLGKIPGGMLRKDAARHWNAMHREIKAKTGIDIRPTGPRSSYRTLYWQRHFYNTMARGMAAVPGTSNHGWGLAVDVATPAMAQAINKYGAKYGYQKAWSDACVPLNTRILTRHGWKTWDEVVEGDETIGYNPDTGSGEWTPIKAVNRQQGNLLSHSHSRLRLVATDNHRWLTPGRGYGKASLKTIEEIDNKDEQARLLLAAPAESGSGLDITNEEAALIGWALTDGSIYKFNNSKGLRAYARVYQKKEIGVGAVESLMENFEHRKFDNWTTDESSHSGGTSAWYVGRNTFTPIYERAKLGELGPVGMVIAMSVEQRQAFLNAAQIAEGIQSTGMRQIAQQKPEIKEAIATAAALEGHLVTLRPRTVNLVRPRVQRNSLKTEELGRAETWCPTTGLGSWLAEQDGQIFLTGNSHEWWHFKWREGNYGLKSKPATKYPVIKKGSKGKAVKRLQVYLRAAGYLRSNHKVHGEYNIWIRRAVRKFQRHAGLKDDGIVNAKTWTALRRAAKRRLK